MVGRQLPRLGEQGVGTGKAVTAVMPEPCGTVPWATQGHHGTQSSKWSGTWFFNLILTQKFEKSISGLGVLFFLLVAQRFSTRVDSSPGTSGGDRWHFGVKAD